MQFNRKKLYEIIFEADTQGGKLFDICLIFLILVSIMLVALDSIATIHEKYSRLLQTSEWIITILFTLEYMTRIYVVNKPSRYIFSFYGIIDLIAILPGIVVFILSGGQNGF